ncbi:YHS domain-containing (seleno)protein [Croceitalea rosinachiae]|uniref:YHS domain-containing (Seleno)protein n=1 Tax=Croceitalea rosinachiae TaxID=3075596 RepID=A0ABU3A5J2_9FLAO|nr:YHS domain-containing (seleno)protein [Croceitalea sp. F388]MDT0605441.1 YHS domain-containing (seleno)protein [Croceitalea sp. F388]
MIRVVVLIVFLAGFNGIGQSIDYNTKKGYVAKGYDVVAYFDNKATLGDDKFTTEYDGVKFKFSIQENLQKFKDNPQKYIPKYGGYCAYAVAVSGKKVSVNPETFEIRNGQLLLFYNSGKTNTLELWKKESPDELKVKADKNWEEIKN